MFEIGKLFWIVFAPANLFVLAVVIGWWAIPRRRAPGAKRWLGIVALLAVIVACTPLPYLSLGVLENRFARPNLPDKIDGIIVLGGGISAALSLERDEPSVTVAAPRLVAFAELARRFPNARLVFSGGAGDIFRPDATEAPIARIALQRMGVDVTRVTFEDRSRNTYENVAFSRELVMPKPGETWLLVTSASHMPRAVGTFRAQGWNVTAWPVGYWTESRPWRHWGFDFLGGLAISQAAMREWIGLGSYYVQGHSDSLLPGSP